MGMRMELSLIKGYRKISYTSVLRAVDKGCNITLLIRLSKPLALVLCRQLVLLCS